MSPHPRPARSSPERAAIHTPRYSKIVSRWVRIILASVFLLAPGLARALTLAPGDVLVRLNIRVDPVTGVQTTIPTQGYPLGPYDLDPEGRPVGFDSIPNSNNFGHYDGLIVRMDPRTGGQTLLLTASMLYQLPADFAIDGAGDIFVLMEGGIYRAQPDDGTVRPIGPVPLSGPAYQLQDLAIGTDGSLYALGYSLISLYDPTIRVVRVDPITGEQTVLSSNGDLRYPSGFEVTPEGRILVVDHQSLFPPDTAGNGEVFEIDPATGAQTMVASGGPLRWPGGIGTDRNGRTFLLDPEYRSDDSLYAAKGALYAFDRPGATLTLVSAGGGLGYGGPAKVVQPYDSPRAIVARPEDLCLVPAFAPPVNAPAELTPIDVATADVNGDGAPDVIASNFFSGTMSVLLGRGDGTLAPEVSYPIGGTYADSLAVGDLNGDKAPDVVVSSFSNFSVVVFLNHGDGTFAPAVPYQTGTSPTSIAIGDLDGDGAPDLAVANNYTRDVALLFGNGDGTFVRRGANLPMGNYPCDAVALGDLNHDGKLDLVAGNGSAGIAVLLGKGDGTFGTRVTYPAGDNANDIVLADFDGDGSLDVAEVDTYDTGVYLMRGRGDGTLDPFVFYQTGGGVWSIAAGDFNRDGRPDLVTSNRGPAVGGSPNNGYAAVLMNYKGGRFAPPVDFGMGRTPGAVAAADMDGDGGQDLIAVNLDSWDVSVRRGLSTVSVGPRRLPFHEQPLGTMSAPGRITVKSCGPAPLEVSGASFTGPEAGAYSVVQDGCGGTTIAPQESCAIDVAFAPAGNGWSSAMLDVESDAGGGPHAVNLRGTSLNSDLELGLQSTNDRFLKGSSAVFTLSLRNSGPTAAHGVVATFTPPGENKVVGMTTSRGSCGIPKSKAKPKLPVCSLGVIEPGGHVTAQFTAKLKGPLYTTLTATAGVTTDTFDPDTTNNTAAASFFIFVRP